ncbi:MAG: CAP domain-containing protein [Actinomycetota bacterium]
MKRATFAVLFSTTALTIAGCTHGARPTATAALAKAPMPEDDHAAMRAASLAPRRRVSVSRSFHRTIPVHRSVVRRTTVRRVAPRRTVTSVYTSRATAASQMASLIESARKDHGLRALVGNSSLASSARAHSSQMAADDRLYHSSSSELWSDARRACGSCTTAGEIIGMGTSVRAIFDAFMADSTHRSEILNRAFRYFGVGVVYAHGAYWVTVQFTG